MRSAEAIPRSRAAEAQAAKRGVDRCRAGKSAKNGREQTHKLRPGSTWLLEHLVGAGKQRWWHTQAKIPGRLKIDEQLDLGGLLNR